MTPGTHLPAADSSCAICLPGTSCTQPTLGDHQGREGKKKREKKKVCVRVIFCCCCCCGFLFVFLAMLRWTNSFDTVSRHGSFAITLCVVHS